jgi:hypothetical protein
LLINSHLVVNLDLNLNLFLLNFDGYLYKRCLVSHRGAKRSAGIGGEGSQRRGGNHWLARALQALYLYM